MSVYDFTRQYVAEDLKHNNAVDPNDLERMVGYAASFISEGQDQTFTPVIMSDIGSHPLNQLGLVEYATTVQPAVYTPRMTVKGKLAILRYQTENKNGTWD